MFISKDRLDKVIKEKFNLPLRIKATSLIIAGNVKVNGQIVIKPSEKIDLSSKIEIIKKDKYVSRGGVKLEEAIKEFSLSVNNKICIDVGSSTGGFTDCLLQYGAERIYSVDVGKGLLDWKLRNNPRVILFEKTNIRYFDKELFPKPTLATIDVSFISLEKVIPKVLEIISEPKEIIALIKPQFEAERWKAKKGVVRDENIHKEVIEKIKKFCANCGLKIVGVIPSPLKGPKGNTEFFIYCKKGGI